MKGIIRKFFENPCIRAIRCDCEPPVLMICLADQREEVVETILRSGDNEASCPNTILQPSSVTLCASALITFCGSDTAVSGD